MINDVVDEAITWPLNPTLSCSIYIAEEVNDVQTDVTYAEIIPIRVVITKIINIECQERNVLLTF